MYIGHTMKDVRHWANVIREKSPEIKEMSYGERFHAVKTDYPEVFSAMVYKGGMKFATQYGAFGAVLVLITNPDLF